MTKRCAKCGGDKPLTEFYRNTQNKDNLHSYCKACILSRAKVRYREVSGPDKRNVDLDTPTDHKNRARWNLAYAIKIGKVVRPEHCSECQIECKPEGHHDDYSKPLEVRWLCRPCHEAHHLK